MTRIRNEFIIQITFHACSSVYLVKFVGRPLKVIRHSLSHLSLEEEIRYSTAETGSWPLSLCGVLQNGEQQNLRMGIICVARGAGKESNVVGY